MATGLLFGCKDGEDADLRVFFEVDKADEAAHAAMVEPADLPGRGWEVTARDAGGDDNADSEFLDMARREPACAQIASLASLGELGGIFGDSVDNDAPAGRAQIELEQPSGSGAFMPVSLEVELEIERTASGVQSGWQIVKELLESEQTRNCIARVVNTMFREQFAESGLQMSLEIRAPQGTAPHGGATMAFAMSLRFPGVLAADGLMEMHFWPYGNGKVTVFVFGSREDMTQPFVRDLMKAVDDKIVKAERAN
jgi:hypothetical protein